MNSSGETVILVQDLVKVYQKSLRAVDGITFDVKKGTVFSLLGPNGAGKTTTVEILEGLRAKTEGTVEIFDSVVGDGRGPPKDKIGILPQDFEVLDDLSAAEMLTYVVELGSRFREQKQERVNDLLAQVGLESKSRTLAEKLSGGEKRKLGIAISLANDPELIFLDEPTTGLDPSARREVWKLIERLKSKQKTILLTTHYLEEAERLADDIAIMNYGKILISGTPTDVILSQGWKYTAKVLVEGNDWQERLRGFEKNSVRRGNVVEVTLDSSVEVQNLISAVNVPGCRLLDIRSPTLEDVYLRLVGETTE